MIKYILFADGVYSTTLKCEHHTFSPTAKQDTIRGTYDVTWTADVREVGIRCSVIFNVGNASGGAASVHVSGTMGNGPWSASENIPDFDFTIDGVSHKGSDSNVQWSMSTSSIPQENWVLNDIRYSATISSIPKPGGTLTVTLMKDI